MLSHQPIDPEGRQRPFWMWRPLVDAWHWLAPPTQAHRDRQSVFARWIARLLWIGLLLGLVVGGAVTARPLYLAWKGWRAVMLVNDARRLSDQGEVFSAFTKAQNAYLLAPDLADAVRLNAEFLTRMKKEEALYFWEKLEGMNAMTPADRQMRVRSLMSVNRRKEAAEELDRLLATEMADDATMKLAEELLGADMFDTNLIPRLKEYAAAHPDDYESLVRLAQLQVNSKQAAEVEEGLARLWEIAALDSSDGLRALERLNASTPFPPEDLNRLIARLESHPKGGTELQVEAIRRRLQLYPGQRTQIITGTMEKFRDAKREELLPLVRWLVDEGEFHQVLAFVDREKALEFQPLLEIYLTCLTMTGKVQELDLMLTDSQVEKILSRAMVTFYRLHMAYVTRRPKEELRELMETCTVHAEIEGRSDLLLSIGGYGEDRGILDAAETAYQLAFRVPRTRLQGLEGLLRVSNANGNTEVFDEAVRAAVQQWPDNPTYREQFLYISLLTGRSLETALFEAETLLALRPSDPQLKLIAAMGSWRFRNDVQSLQRLQRIDLSALTPGQRVVYAAVIRTAGYSEEARRVIADLPADALMFPEERSLFEFAR